MQTIKKDELFRNLGDFLKSKGIELNEGSYTTRIQKGCNLLADAINATQKTVSKTKVKVDQALDQLRQTIHESTAPPPPPETKSKTKATPHTKRPKPAPKSQRPKAGRKD
ncbi:MAG: hypothetical protein U1F83_08280 [Verrucomicrobiota bacterium]